MKKLPKNPGWLMKNAVYMSEKKRLRISKWLCLLQRLLNPNDYFALCWYADALYMLGKNNDEKADSLYRRAIKINPNHPLAHVGLGRIHYYNALKINEEYSILGSDAWSMFAGELSIEEIEDETKLSVLFSHSDQHQGNRNVAIHELETAAKFSNDINEKKDLLLMAANIYCIIDNNKGIHAYRNIIKLESNNIEAHYHLAGCYAAIGEHKLAINEYNYIKKHAPKLKEKVKKIFTKFGIDEDGEINGNP